MEDRNIGTEENPKVIKLSKNFPEREKEEYVNLMKKYIDVFAWSYEDLKEYDTSIIQHTIPINPGERPFKQKLRRINPKLLPIIEKEIKKLFDAKIIVTLRFSKWVANLVLDDDCHVNEVILGFLLKMSSMSAESQSVHVFNFDEYLAKTIHIQLSEFPKVIFFKFQTYLLNMLLCSNVSELQFLSTIFSSDLPKQISMFEFTNSIMSEIYKMMFDEVLPRVLEDMKSMMQSSPKDRIGDWFLYKDFTILRIYGFTGKPYRFPAFLIPRIFALEYMRQRVHA